MLSPQHYWEIFQYAKIYRVADVWEKKSWKWTFSLTLVLLPFKFSQNSKEVFISNVANGINRRSSQPWDVFGLSFEDFIPVGSKWCQAQRWTLSTAGYGLCCVSTEHQSWVQEVPICSFTHFYMCIFVALCSLKHEPQGRCPSCPGLRMVLVKISIKCWKYKEKNLKRICETTFLLCKVVYWGRVM